MAGNTPNLDLYLPGGGSTDVWNPDETADIDPLNQNFQKIDTAVGDPDNQNRQWYGPAASIGSLPVSPKDGDTYQESDGNKILWKRVGGVWVTNEGGMFLLRPTSITNGTVDAGGAIVPTAGQTNVVLDFTTAVFARFRAIHLKFFLEPTTPASPALQFRRAGVALAAAASYGNQRQLSNGATRSSDFVTGTFFDLGVSSQDVTAGEVTLFNLGEAATRKAWVGSFYQGPTNPNNVQIAGQKNDAEMLAAIDGFLVTFGSGTFKSGSKNFIKVYGMA